MSGVHKSERSESKFEVLDHAVLLKNKIRELSILRNFGYKVRTSKTPRNFEQWSEKSRENWKIKEEERLNKLKWLDKCFLAEKRKEVDADLMQLMHGISAANSIQHPVSMNEADERRIYQDRAIAACENLRIDLQDIMDTLPIDKNWMTHVEPDIAKEIALLKGWRKSDNNMRTAIRNADMKRWVKFLEQSIKDGDNNAVVNMLYQTFLNGMERRELEIKSDNTPKP